mgnify:CR=1 FL=1
MNQPNKYYDKYFDHVLNKGQEQLTKSEMIVFDIINDISDRRGIKHEWDGIDGDIQEEIIDTWKSIIEKRMAI